MNPTDRISEIPALPNQKGLANVPGIRRLWLIETRHVLGLTDPRTIAGALDTGLSLTETGLQILEDAVISELKFPAGRGSHEQKGTNSVQGISFGQSILLEVPRDHALVSLFAQRMSGRKWLAIYQDGNGIRKLVGTPKQPLRFQANYKSTPNTWSFSWAGDTRQPAYFFTDNGLLDYWSDADFSFGFSYDFYS